MSNIGLAIPMQSQDAKAKDIALAKESRREVDLSALAASSVVLVGTCSGRDCPARGKFSRV